MRMFLSEDLIKTPVINSKWLSSCFGFLIVVQFMDGLTTKIGLDLGLAEVGTYTMPNLEAIAVFLKLTPGDTLEWTVNTTGNERAMAVKKSKS